MAVKMAHPHTPLQQEWDDNQQDNEINSKTMRQQLKGGGGEAMKDRNGSQTRLSVFVSFFFLRVSSY